MQDEFSTQCARAATFHERGLLRFGTFFHIVWHDGLLFNLRRDGINQKLVDPTCPEDLSKTSSPALDKLLYSYVMRRR